MTLTLNKLFLCLHDGTTLHHSNPQPPIHSPVRYRIATPQLTLKEQRLQ